MKILVGVTGPHFYMCPITSQTIESDRPCVVESTQFFQSLVARGHLKVHPTPLQETATDAEFLKFLTASEKDVELATNSFLSKYAVGAVAEEDAEAQAEAQRLAEAAAAEAARVAAEVEAQNKAAADAEAAAKLADAEAAAKLAAEKAAADAEAAAKLAAEKKTTTATKK